MPREAVAWTLAASMRCPAECRAACGDLLYFSTRFKTPRTVIVHDACLSWISVFLQMLVVLYVVVVQVCLRRARAVSMNVGSAETCVKRSLPRWPKHSSS